MNRRSFLATLASVPSLAQHQRPNIVIIVADDLGWGDIGANGCPDIRTPNIDRIAKEGIRFTQSYASAPECTPTRCALLTGRYQQRVGGLECAIGVLNQGRYDEAQWLQKKGELGLPASEPTLPSMLRKAGYHTAITGKWHLGYLPKFWPGKHGFHYSFGILGGNADYFTYQEQFEASGGPPQFFENGTEIKPKGYMTDLIADAALSWLKARTSAPFFLYLPFTAPHTPIQAVEDYDEKTGTAPHRARHRPTYARMVEHMDKRIGDILAQLDRMKAAENTIVVFTSDNGADVNGGNEPFRGRKSSVWEGGIRAPLHIRWLRHIDAGQTTTQVALSMDLAPTLLTAAGIQPERELDGIDLLPVLQGRKAPASRTVFWRYKRAGNVRRAVRHGDWKLADDSGSVTLHNLKSDPSETKDLASEQPDVLRDLQARLIKWEKDVQAPRLAGFRATSNQP